MSENKKNIPIEDEAEVKVTDDEAAEEVNEISDEIAEEVKDAEDVAEETSGETSENADDKESEQIDEDSEQASEEAESERYMRLMAEFQNFKKRAAKEKSDIHAFANERIVNDLLPVLDNFERALEEKTGDSEELGSYVKGMELIFDQLKKALENAGLKEIAALGEDFDPAFHNAVMTEPSEEYEDGKISKVLQKGYTLNDRVIRPSMVAVSKSQ